MVVTVIIAFKYDFVFRQSVLFVSFLDKKNKMYKKGNWEEKDMAIELTKKDIAELSAIVQQNVEAELQGDKLQRMQAFGKEDGTIDTNGVLAFALSEAKLYATMFTTQLLNAIYDAQHEPNDKE